MKRLTYPLAVIVPAVLATWLAVASAAESDEAARLNQRAVELANQGKLPDALAAAKQGLTLREQSRGEKHLETAQSLNNVGVLLQLSGKGRDALPYLRRAVAVYTEVRGPEHAETLQCLNSLGFLEASLGDLDGAKKTFELLLAARLKTLGRDHLDTASAADNLGEILFAKGSYKESRSRSEQALEIRLRALGEKHVDSALTLNRLGGICNAMGDYRLAQQYFGRALEARTAIFGEKHALTAESINNMGAVATHLGDYAEARRRYARALKIQREVLAENSEPIALSLYNLGSVEEHEGNILGAQQYFEQALALRRKVLGEKHPRTVSAMLRVAAIKRNLRRFDEARTLLERALAIDEEVLSKDHPDIAEVLYHLAKLRIDMDDWADAERCIQRTIAIRAAALGKNHIDYATALAVLANLQRQNRDWPAAKATCDERLAIVLGVYGSDHPAVAAARQGLGAVLVSQRDFPAAHEQLEKALEICEKALGPDHPSTAALLIDLGGLAVEERKYSEAQSYYFRLLDIRQRKSGPRHRDTASALHRLANTAKLLGDVAQARKYAEQALTIWESTDRASPQSIRNTCTLLGDLLAVSDPAASRRYYERALKAAGPALDEDSVQAAATFSQMGTALWQRAQIEEARPYLERALKIQQAKLGEKDQRTVVTMNMLALTLHQLGEMETARGLFEKSLAIHREVLGNDHPDTAAALHNFGLYHGSVKAWSEASADFDEAQRISQRFIVRELPRLTPKEQIAFLKDVRAQRFHTATSLALLARDDQAIVDRSASWVLNTKAVAQEALAESMLAARDSDPQIKKLSDELADLRAKLSKLTVTAPAPGQRQTSAAERAELQRREEDVSKRLALAGHSNLPGRGWTELATVREALPKGTVLVEVAKIRRFDFFRRVGRRQEWRYAAWVIPHAGEGEVRLVDLGFASAIEADVAAFRKVVDPTRTFTLAEFALDDAAIRSSLRKVAASVLEPLLPAIGDAERLIVCPDASLWLVPWEALPVSAEKFAVERYKISYELSGRHLLDNGPRDVSNEPGLVLADPDYNAEQATAATSPPFIQAIDPARLPPVRLARSAFAELTPLPVTRAAARALLPKLSKYLGKEPQLLLGSAASESAFRAARRPRMLLIATHGYYLPGEDDTAGDSETTNSAALSAGGDCHPLLRCGLALAGANLNKNLSNSAVDDGILTGLEIIATDLRGTELVVLDACQTGLGDVRSGEGLAGLSQAFQLAGCRTVIGSLWSVSTTHSSVLMIDFCQNLAAGQSKADALRNAELSMIHTLRSLGRPVNPRVWAPFTVIGHAAPSMD